MTRRNLVVASLLFFPAAVLAAQGERINLRWAPAPNQTIHLRATQDMQMKMDPDAPAPDTRPIPPIDMVMHTVVDTTSVVGPTDAAGHYTAALTIDNMAATMTMNGREMPIPAAMNDPAARPVITFSYDDQGRVLSISTGDASAPNPAAEFAKQILSRAMASAGPITLSVGETVTVPAAFEFPMPAGAPIMPMGIKGETRFTLTSISFDGADRIAHLTSHSTGTISQAPPAGAASISFDLTMTTEGKSDVNVDRGFIVHSEQRSTMEGTMRGAATASVMPGMRMHGTFTNASDVVK